MGIEKKLCPYAESCSESDYGDREICSNDCGACGNYFLFEKGDIIIEMLPCGTLPEASETLPVIYS